MMLREFRKLSESNQKELIKQIKYKYLNELKNQECIAKELDIVQTGIRKLIEENNIKRTKEQIIDARKKYNLETYGDENYCNSEKIKKSLANNNFNYGENAQIKIAEKILKEQGLYSWIILTAEQKDYYKNEIIKLMNEGNYDEEIYQHLKLTKGCYNRIKKEYNIKRDNEQHQKIIERRINDKYGVNNVGELDWVKDKIKRTNLKNGGYKYSFQRPDVKEKIKQTKLERYGTKHPTQNQEIKEKINQTCKDRYNVEWPCQLSQCINKSNSISKINQRFADLLIDNSIEYEQEFVLKNRKYDFKVDNYLIEINPTYTHNSTIGCGFNGHYENPMDKYYHLEKSNLAKKNGYFCIHIFDWDNWNKIINLLLSKRKIYARNCEVKEVSKNECHEFLNKYHLQNTCRGQNIRLGLYYNNELVELMTFGKPRYNKNYEYELLRLCSHKDYQIIGGSKRLWSRFLDIFKPTNIISYCDNSKFSGAIYERLGMYLTTAQSPSCIWSKGIQKITDNLLRQQGYDRLFNTTHGKNYSNRQLMLDNGWREVYDCGQNIWTINLND